MAKTLLTFAMLAAQAGPYFASNTDVGLLLGTTHGTFYRPENRSYAEHDARVNGSEVVEILLDDYRAAVAPRPSLADLVAGATHFFFPAMQVAPADGVVKEGIALIADGQLSEVALVGDGLGQALPTAPAPADPANEQPAAPAPAAPEVSTAPTKRATRKPAAPKAESAK